MTTNRAVVGLASALLFAPTMAFAASLRAPLAALELVGCIGALALILQRRQAIENGFLDAAINRRDLVLAIALAVGLLVIGGAGHLVYPPADWRTRDAVLADMALRGFPILYSHDGVDYLLRAPLAMYVLPALVGRASGLMAAHLALLAQNSLLLGASIYVFAQVGRGWAHVLVVLAFAGSALLGVWIYYALSDKTLIDHMLKFSMDAWNPYFQYSGSLVQIFWVPNHAGPAWWLAALMILQSKKETDVATIAATIGGAMFWSPLIVLPAFLWVALRALVDWRTVLMSRRIWLVALVAPCFAPIAYYMMAGAGSIDHGFAWTKPMFVVIYLIFIVAQLVHVAYLLAYRASLPSYLVALLAFSVCVLLTLPMFNFGLANDLVMRASIAPLVVLAFAFGSVMLAPENRGQRPYWVGVAFVMVCAPSALLELSRPFTHTRYDISDCSLIQTNANLWGEILPMNYLSDRKTVPDWLIDLRHAARGPTDARDCWADHGDQDRPDTPPPTARKGH